jgi:RHS repeat-associated protein
VSGSAAAGCGLGKRAVGAGFPRTSSPDGTLTDHAVQYGFDPQTGRLKNIIHGDTDFGIPERAFVQSYLAHSHLPDTLTAPLHQTVRTWEANRDALKSIRSTTPGAGGTNFLTAAYGDANFAVNGIGQRTSADYSGEIYQSLYSSQENYTAAGAYTYGYNANGELVSQTGGKSHGYQYDPIGNRLEATAAGNTVATYQPNALNQYDAIITAGPTTVNPQHDPDGNLVNDGTKRYVWDAENRLIEVRQATGDALIASYRYDSMSRRIYKQTTALAPQGAGEAVFVYDGWNLVCEYSISNNQASVTRAYTWGLDLSGSLQVSGGVGGLLAIENKTFGSSLQGVYYPLYDGNGNVLATLEDSGSSTSVADAYHYDPFGKTFLSVGDSDNPFRFSTKYFDQETGFYYYGYRYYDPVTGRWPSRDPIEEEGGGTCLVLLVMPP